jgi:nitrate reductase assembly molybdenum cofactor insertion protein NarJ
VLQGPDTLKKKYEAHILKPKDSPELSDFQVIMLPALTVTPCGPTVPEYALPFTSKTSVAENVENMLA